jgi:fluoride exporter
MTLLFVALGAAVGAPLRYLTDRAVQSRHDSAFPWGTLAVNASGSLLLCFLAALPAGAAVMALAGTGLCGALTTFSTFSYETLRLAQENAYGYAAANVAANVTVGLAAGYGGLALAHLIT